MRNKKKKTVQSAEVNTAPQLTPEEIRLLEARRKQTGEDRSKLPPFDNGDRAQTVRYAKKNTFLTVSVLISVIALLLAIILLFVFISRDLSDGINKSDYTFKFGKTEYEVKYKNTVFDGVLYIDMNELAKYSDMTVSGSTDKIKFTVSENEYLRFENDSEYAVVNGSKVIIKEPVYVNSGECLVPYKFISNVTASGLKFKLDTKDNIVTVERPLTDKNDTESYEKITFTTASYKTIAAISNTTGKSYDYNIDITDYLKYVQPDDASPYLLLVNKQNPLGSDYVPDNLVTLTCPVNNGHSADYYKLSLYAERALYAMMEEMKADGITDVYVTSSYRTYSRQKELYDSRVNSYINTGMSRTDAEAKVLEKTAFPGTSEHQSGLGVDFCTSGTDYLYDDTPQFKWLSENSYKFGFILRYPKEKTNVTGYNYEDWHYRFVGRTAATGIHFSGLCLEEYLELN